MTTTLVGHVTGLTATVTTQKIIFAIAVHKEVTVKILNDDATNTVNWVVKAFHHPTDPIARLLITDIPTNGVDTVAVSTPVLKEDFDDAPVPDNKAYTHLVVEYVRATVDVTPISVQVFGRPSK